MAIPSSIPTTLADLSPFNIIIDKDPQTVSHSRASLFQLENECKKSKQNNQSLYGEKQSINSISPVSELVVTVPVRSSPLPYGTVPLSESPKPAQYVTIPNATFTIPNRTDTIQYGTIQDQNFAPVTVPVRLNSLQLDTCNSVPPHNTVPSSFVQGLNIPKRTDSCLRNKYKQMRKLSRTPLVVPRIIECAKDANPHLDQDNIMTAITMDLEVAPLAVSKPVPAAPEITQTGVCSNSSPNKHHHPKPNHTSGGKEESYRFSARLHKQRSYMPMAGRTTEEKTYLLSP